MPSRLAIQASRVHNAWLCLIWIVSFFRPRAKKSLRTVNASTAVCAFTALSVAFGMAGAKGATAPDHHPEVTTVCFQSLWNTLMTFGGRLRRPLHEAGRNAPPKG